jgi:hypothetical protein
VNGRTFLAEQLAELREGKEVAVVGKSGDSEGILRHSVTVST